MWAYASKYALESTLQNTKSKLDSKGIKSQKATEITELESSTDCKKIEANKPKQLKVWLIYPLCERTKALQEKWQKPTQGQPKQWYFKASIPHNKSHKTYEENQENGAISLFVAFFRLQISIDYNPYQFSRVRYKSQKAIKSTKTLWIL